MKKKQTSSILVIEDDPVFRNIIKTYLNKKYTLFLAETPSEGFKLLKEENIDIVICDYLLPELSGLEFLEAMKKKCPGIELILISNAGDMDTVIESLRKGASDYLRKPFDASDLLTSLERTLNLQEIKSELSTARSLNRKLRTEMKTVLGFEMIGSSSLTQKIREQMELVAQTPDTSVLILGESGSGKELIARGIHEASNRRDNMFNPVNMSAVPDTLFESEFFGHKKGSFTGAISDNAGWFESTNNGTLFLDEVGEMNRALQVKLLRVLEDRQYRPIGSQKTRNYDIRILSATNKTLEELSEGNSFRLDLFHRLSTFIITVPPLRERKEDIPDLTNHFLHSISQRNGKLINSIHESVFQLLDSYSFPGNIRELKNLVERAVIYCQGNELLPEHFGDLPGTLSAGNGTPELNQFDLNELERRTILNALKATSFNKAKAARLLNLEWNALDRRIRKHDIGIQDKPIV